MHSLYLVALFPLAAYATLYGRCSGPSEGGKATGFYLDDGICDYTTDCNHRTGSHISNGCPYDNNDVTCCVIGLGDSRDTNPCGGTSYCTWESNGCIDGQWVSNHCPGGSNYKCCKRG